MMAKIDRMTRIKGQMSFTVKPFTMLMMIVLLLFLLMFLNSSEVKKEKAQRDLELRSAATDVLLILANSEDCLAYQLPTGESAYANIVDVKKLDSFSLEYQGIEPMCARNYDFGFRVEVSEIVMTDLGSRVGKTWTFGRGNFSREYYDNKMSYIMPIAIKYSEKEVGLGRLNLTVVDGQLDRIAGFLDRACMMGKSSCKNQSSAKISLDYPLSYSEGELCIGLKNKDCRKLLCELDMKDIKSKGTYRLATSFEYPNRLIVRV
ncbi:MAG: hypothetical protein JW727_01270 [Candidatus Aenigmarchaeota archaeon]|nr:hypothetical protein [Candidatus Aenigmarchaeota archaeon]